MVLLFPLHVHPLQHPSSSLYVAGHKSHLPGKRSLLGNICRQKMWEKMPCQGEQVENRA